MDRSIADFYDGQSIFITGGTGFLGKVLVEKLLYSFSGISKIYLLMRQKCDADIHKSLQDMLEKPVFLRLRNERPKSLNKIIPIIGDISEPKLGINEEDEQMLIENVSIVFHAAATVRFNEPLKIAVNINVLGTLRVLDLCQRMRNKKAFVHVSTAYSNVNRKFVEEVIYPAPATLEEVENLIKAGITKDEVQRLISTKGRKNTYLFTKAIAESMVAQNHDTIPTIIVRPSVITSSKVEPIVGWIDSWLGASSLTNAIAKGLNRVILGHPNNCVDLIPVDYVSNLIVVAAAKGTRSEDVAVYGSCTSEINPITMKSLIDMCITETVKHKFNDLPMPFCFYTRSKWLVTTITFLIQIIPAYIADMFLWIIGKRKRYLKLQTTVTLVRDTLENFTNNSWVISAAKSTALYKSLSPSEREQFPFDPADIDWKEYIPSYCAGLGVKIYDFGGKQATWCTKAALRAFCVSSRLMCSSCLLLV
ncbi:unnamed protein product, partial [Brenthis ino]